MPALEPDAERHSALSAEYFLALANDLRVLTRPAAELFAVRNGQALSCAAFLADVASCAEALPQARFVINLCTDRYRFTVAFFAAAQRGQTTLLPSQRSAEAIDTLRRDYPSCRVIADNPDTASDCLIDFAPGKNGNASAPLIDADHTVAIAFTSGSTGTPQAHAKSWGLLANGRATHARYLVESFATAPARKLDGLVSTVPSWHMYGLEWAMLLPTIAPLQLFCGPDFFPGDVTTALDSFGSSSENLLVSTPVHLRALLKSPPPTSKLARVVCATAPIDPPTVLATQEHLTTQLFEIYGCSEIGSLACRQPADNEGWTFFDTIELDYSDNELRVGSHLLTDEVTLADRFGQLDEHRYELLGRATDIVKVAGKRESLANLNAVLLSLPGVDDGVVYQPDALGVPGGERLAAFVVGAALDVNQLRTALLRRLDPIFVPRPIRIVAALPRDTTSKLKVAELKQLAEKFADG